MLQHLADQAEREKLAETSPVKERLALHRAQVLAQAIAERKRADVNVSPEDVQKRYETDKDKYEEAKIRAIHVGYEAPNVTNINMSDPTKPQAVAAPRRTDAEAKVRIEEALKKARAGGDFAQLAKEYSDDKTTAVKGGDYGSIRKVDNLPNDLKEAVFARKPGEITDPIKQPNGYLILKVEERRQQPLSEVQQQLSQLIHLERYNAWMQGLEKQFVVTIENPTFFGVPPPTPTLPSPPVSPAK
jgi:parvulin-like peptidyl-prolyl isomerase